MAVSDEQVRDAALEYANKVGYSGSVEALGVSNAFFFGAMNQGSNSDVRLIEAFIAGLVWNAEQEARNAHPAGKGL